jgi:hypothetical protein
MNIHDHYNDLLHLLDLSGYPCKHLDGRAVVQYVDDGTGDTWDTEQVADCCDYLTGILVAHMEQLDQPSPSIREACEHLLGQVGEDEEHGRAIDEATDSACNVLREWLDRNQPEHKDTQADVDQAIRRLKEIQARSKGGAA